MANYGNHHGIGGHIDRGGTNMDRIGDPKHIGTKVSPMIPTIGIV